MQPSSRQSGLTLTDLLVSLSLFTLVFLGALAAFTQGTTLSRHATSLVMIQDGLRVGMEMLERDARQIGFGLPDGQEIGSTTVWTPAIFHASPIELGFRGAIEGTNASITCTPSAENSNCEPDLLRIDTTARFEELNCEQPDDPGVPLKLIVVGVGGIWETTECSSVDVSDGSISVADVTDNVFTAGASEVLSVEHVYYRYVPGTQPTYGYLERYVHYDNQPDETFPHPSGEWTVVVDHLTDFWLEYRDAQGNPVTGDPLTLTERQSVTSVVLFMEGYDRVGPQGKVQMVRMSSEVRIRNAGA